ncbi:MAG: cytochrome c biogenesis protein CcsA [Candidatus Promineofilum sp.]|nr:cytochrome c biogenesis protein CcsA [Promineifilum sp.]MCW5863274.1 cytochrome c biogenesis protein CcsA [Anaerolineae bacterium]
MNPATIVNPRLDRAIRIMSILAVVGMVITIGAIFLFAPVELNMGNVQRLFYFHVGSAWVGAMVFGVALVCGVLYLWRGRRVFDTVSLASVEVGLVFLSMAIVGGSFWGKPAWNTWWLWSPRLTLVTVAWLVYAAYFMLRGAIEDDHRRARYAAIYAIVSFVTIILTYISIRIFRDIHPVVFGGTTEAAAGAAEGLQDFNGLDSARMGITLLISVIGFTLLGSAWILMRIRLQNLIDYADGLKMRVAARLSARPRPAVVSGLALVLSQVGEPNQFNAYLIGGYTVMSAFCLLYMGYLAMRQRNLQGDIALLTQLLQEGDRPRR